MPPSFAWRGTKGEKSIVCSAFKADNRARFVIMETETVIWIQRNASSLYWPMRLLSELGPSTTLGVFLAGLYWCWDYQKMSRIWVMNFATMWFTSVLKIVLHTPRPYWIQSDVQGLTRASGFGMPSGHALVSTAVWGELGRHLSRHRALLVCLPIILGVGISRLYLGVHSLAQVIVGIGLGVGFVVLAPAAERIIVARFSNWPLRYQIGMVFFLSLCACGIGLLVRVALSSWEVPAEWVQMALAKRPKDGVINPLSLHSTVISAASMAGFLSGYLILRFKQWDRRPRTWKERIMRVLVGGITAGPYVFLTRRFLRGGATAELPFFASLTLDYAYGTLTGLIIGLLVPLLFCRLKI